LVINALNTNTTGGQNTALGANALQANIASANTALGYYALYGNTTGSSNIAVGGFALEGVNNGTGGQNIAIGNEAMQEKHLWRKLTWLSASRPWKPMWVVVNNVSVGYEALYANTSGTQNTAIGMFALSTAAPQAIIPVWGIMPCRQNVSGTQNTALGSGALSANYN